MVPAQRFEEGHTLLALRRGWGRCHPGALLALITHREIYNKSESSLSQLTRKLKTVIEHSHSETLLAGWKPETGC